MKTKDTEIARNKIKSNSEERLDNKKVTNRKHIRHDNDKNQKLKQGEDTSEK